MLSALGRVVRAVSGVRPPEAQHDDEQFFPPTPPNEVHEQQGLPPRAPKPATPKAPSRGVFGWLEGVGLQPAGATLRASGLQALNGHVGRLWPQGPPQGFLLHLAAAGLEEVVGEEAGAELLGAAPPEDDLLEIIFAVWKRMPPGTREDRFRAVAGVAWSLSSGGRALRESLARDTLPPRSAKDEGRQRTAQMLDQLGGERGASGAGPQFSPQPRLPQHQPQPHQEDLFEEFRGENFRPQQIPPPRAQQQQGWPPEFLDERPRQQNQEPRQQELVEELLAEVALLRAALAEKGARSSKSARSATTSSRSTTTSSESTASSASENEFRFRSPKTVWNPRRWEAEARRGGSEDDLREQLLLEVGVPHRLPNAGASATQLAAHESADVCVGWLRRGCPEVGRHAVKAALRQLWRQYLFKLPGATPDSVDAGVRKLKSRKLPKKLRESEAAATKELAKKTPAKAAFPTKEAKLPPKPKEYDATAWKALSAEKKAAHIAAKKAYRDATA